jgi:hypothetical protein
MKDTDDDDDPISALLDGVKKKDQGQRKSATAKYEIANAIDDRISGLAAERGVAKRALAERLLEDALKRLGR